MDYLKKAIWGPDPKEQMRKCQSLLRKNKRQLERNINELNPVEKKTTSLIKQSVKKGDLKTAKLYARELRNIQKQKTRLNISRATVDSIGMKLNEQQQMIKITGSLQKSTEIMRQVNQLVKLPEINNSIQELSKELMKSGIIEEMTDDMLEDVGYDELENDEDEQEAIDDIIKQIVGDKQEVEQESQMVNPSINTPQQVVPNEDTEISNTFERHAIAVGVNDGEDDDGDHDSIISNMRERLKALQEPS